MGPAKKRDGVLSAEFLTRKIRKQSFVVSLYFGILFLLQNQKQQLNLIVQFFKFSFLATTHVFIGSL
jgi:hypothetical protein